MIHATHDAGIPQPQASHLTRSVSNTEPAGTDKQAVMAAVTLSLTSAAAAVHYWWVLAMAPLLVALLFPPVLGGAPDEGGGARDLPARGLRERRGDPPVTGRRLERARDAQQVPV